MNIFARSHKTKVQFSPQAAGNLPKEIKVPCNSLTLYQGAEYWSNFTNYGCFVGLDNFLIKNLSTKLYPNPASDIINLDIEYLKENNLTLNIYNIMGLLVKSKIIAKNQRQINVGDLNNGFYL